VKSKRKISDIKNQKLGKRDQERERGCLGNYWLKKSEEELPEDLATPKRLKKPLAWDVDGKGTGTRARKREGRASLG